MVKAELGDRVDLRFFAGKGSFHPKSYIFHFHNKTGENETEVFIGSSNVSRSALTTGIEWNYRLTSRRDKNACDTFCDTFEYFFQNHSVMVDDEVLRNYSSSWHRPSVYQDFEKYGDPDDPKVKVQPIFRPRGIQIEALYALQKSREEGAKRALVHAATGVGKTFLAAFDSRGFNRILFVAHRKEIIDQARRTFACVRAHDSVGIFGSGTKDTDADLTFAMVETLGKAEYLNPNYFAPDAFDYIVIDEFHHAVTKQYRKIIDYFRPAFLLGLTATPERMDGRDIYELLDYNVPFEIDMRDAINRGALVPFHYYGVYDETDYSCLRLVRGHYDEAELEQIYIGNQRRYDLIWKYYRKYPSERALGFCSTRKHAEDMAREFVQRGIAAAAVYSGGQGDHAMDRDQALAQLRAGKLNVLFSVDMFNEGVDVPDVDMVLFLRPTESPVIFLQQLGRGLRQAKGKEYLTVLDFIGNYKMAGRIPSFLIGDGKNHPRVTGERQSPDTYPDGCIVDFDMRLIDLFREMRKKNQKTQDIIDAEFDRIRDELGHTPSRIELFSRMEDDIYTLALTHPANNPFPKYLQYLHKRGLLTMEERKIHDGIGREFLDLVSTTSMTKVYKMPILYAFYNGGKPVTEVTDDEVLKQWKIFFDRGSNWKDLVSGKGNAKDKHFQDYVKITDPQHLRKIHTMPIHFLLKSGNGFFIEKPGCALAVHEDLKEIFQDPAFADHFRDILDYRTMDYFRRRYVEDSKTGDFVY